MNKISFLFCLFICLGINALQAQSKLTPIDVERYDFTVEIFAETDRIEAEAKVQVLVTEELETVVLDLVSEADGTGMKVSSVQVGGKSVRSRHLNDQLHVMLSARAQPGDELNITIAYAGIPRDGLIISKNKFGERTFFGDNWPNRAHHWLPVVDHPSDKALVSWAVTAPTYYKVIANGTLQETRDLDKRHFYRYQSEVPLPTKVMVFGAANFSTREYYPVYNIPVSAWVFADNAEAGFGDYAPATKALKFFIEHIGPYQYSKLANVQSKTRYGGMENASCIFYYENSVTGKGTVEDLIAHEVAHQWFGNCATEADWAHIWLSEGFATYGADLYIENQYGEEKFRERMLGERAQAISHAGRSNAAIIDSTYKDINSLLNPNSYERGAWVLHMLRHEIGDEAFWQVLKDYYEQHLNENAFTMDLRRVVEEETGNNMKWFFDQWLRRADYPELLVEWKEVGDITRLVVKQTQDGPAFRMKLEVRLDSPEGKGETLHLLLTEKEQVYEEEIPYEVVGATLDPNVKLFFSGKVREGR